MGALRQLLKQVKRVALIAAPDPVLSSKVNLSIDRENVAIYRREHKEESKEENNEELDEVKREAEGHL